MNKFCFNSVFRRPMRSSIAMHLRNVPLYLSHLVHCFAFFFSMDRSHQDLSGLLALTMTEIITALPPETFSRIERRSRRDLEHAVSRLPEHALEILLDLAKRKIV